MRARKLFFHFKKKIISATDIENNIKIDNLSYLRFLTILILQYLSNADQELKVALLLVPTCVIKIGLPYESMMVTKWCAHT